MVPLAYCILRKPGLMACNRQCRLSKNRAHLNRFLFMRTLRRRNEISLAVADLNYPIHPTPEGVGFLGRFCKTPSPRLGNQDGTATAEGSVG